MTPLTRGSVDPGSKLCAIVPLISMWSRRTEGCEHGVRSKTLQWDCLEPSHIEACTALYSAEFRTTKENRKNAVCLCLTESRRPLLLKRSMLASREGEEGAWGRACLDGDKSKRCSALASAKSLLTAFFSCSSPSSLMSLSVTLPRHDRFESFASRHWPAKYEGMQDPGTTGVFRTPPNSAHCLKTSRSSELVNKKGR